MKKILVLAGILLFASSWLTAQTNSPANAGESRQREARQTFQALEQDWANAVKQRDPEKLARLEAEEYEFTDPAGQIWTKARQLETIKAGDLEIDSFELTELKVRLYGDTAVVNFRIVWNGRYLGADISGPQRVTDVFVKRDGRWQCVASHTTRMARP